ncbi:MAG: tRNA threonylcarbamoyladenosine dehydratase [Rhodoferax sp.]
MESAADLERRFAGLERLFGVAGAQWVQQSHVAVVGIGGVGSWAAEALARSGVAQLTLIDMDHVAESNVNRQVHAVSATLGQSKILAMRDRIAQINPECQVTCVDDFVGTDNWPAILPGRVDAVIDACDQVPAKTAMAQWARTQKVLFVSAGAAGGKRLGHCVEVCDLSAVTHDPLLAKVRYTLRKVYAAPKEGKKMGVACVFSREAVQLPQDACAAPTDGTLNCHGYGSLVTVTAAFGLCAAGWVMQQLSQRPR